MLTRLNGKPFALNADLIERIETNPDTTVTLADGQRYIVRESITQVLELAEDYKARVLARARSVPERPHRPIVVDALPGEHSEQELEDQPSRRPALKIAPSPDPRTK